MTDNTELTQARVEPVTSWSKVWLIPLIALGVGVWMVYHQLSQQGPMIQIEFRSAEGLEPGKTKIRARDVEVGLVKEITLGKDLSSVLVTARMTADAAPLLTQDANFWVVRPKVSLSGISGLSTLLSGAYIKLEPGNSSESAVQFNGLDTPPLTPAGAPGLHLTLSSGQDFAYAAGDPILYKGMEVGKIDHVHFNVAERTVYYNAFIQAPYDKLITTHTRFWNISGIKMDLSAEGVSVQSGTFQTLLTSGVTFGIPEHLPQGEVVNERTYFKVYPDYAQATTPDFKFSQEFLLLFKDSVKGLYAGAPVTYRGLNIGKVLAVNLPIGSAQAYLDTHYQIPVLIALYPGQIGLSDDIQGRELLTEQMDAWIQNGLRAALGNGNLLTGKQLVELSYTPTLQSEIQLASLREYRVIPTVSGELSQLTEKFSALLDKFNALPLQDMSSNLNDVLASSAQTMQELQVTLQGMQSMLGDVKDKQLIGQLSATLASVEKLARDFSQGSSTQGDIQQTLQQIQRTLQQSQPLLQQLNQSPNSLIFSGQGPEPQPKAQGAQ
ncbi:intermembrane transport protein PqiB [Bowmanella pacifica]|uniref:Paraquat-inducible protein B n=1 Tax=Bowmanella pacifica TaxID=502051 RepID=A0A917Z6A4_9ALTE|nr:intermembrane transport protein PqiB [Bowmanella pacifica]GGO74017.1 paraquat-inducible protein B [Bowmanella pacifica]